jgi:hypothetical protein
MSVYWSRRGVALIAALSLLAMLGLIIIGAVAASSMSAHAIHLSLADGGLLGAADHAAGEVLADPLGFGLPDLPLQRTHMFDVPSPALGLATKASATRLPLGSYWVVGEAVADAGTGRRRVGVIARTRWIGRPPTSPFVARGSTALSADVIVLPDSGGEPDCAVSAVPLPIQTTDSTLIFDTSSQWGALAARPGVRLTAGDTILSAGSFEGILMVAGNLTLDGPFEATGLIIARGRVRSTVGFHLTGALVSQSSADPSIDLHGATVRYAPCVVSRLLRRASPIVSLRSWGWAELF